MVCRFEKTVKGNGKAWATLVQLQQLFLRTGSGPPTGPRSPHAAARPPTSCCAPDVRQGGLHATNCNVWYVIGVITWPYAPRPRRPDAACLSYPIIKYT